jgi:hypothetical protein
MQDRAALLGAYHCSSQSGTHLDPIKMQPQALDKEGISPKRLYANKAAKIYQVHPLQIVQRQLIIEKLGELHNFMVVHWLPGTNLQPSRCSQPPRKKHDVSNYWATSPMVNCSKCAKRMQ